MKPKEIEQEIQDKGLTAPRVTLEDIEANIAAECFFVAADAHRFEWLTRDDRIARDAQRSILESMATRSYSGACIDIDANNPIPDALKLLTFCVLILRNGFTVTGESACVSPENFDAELGRKIARQNAIAKVWPLMGYALRERLFLREEK